MEPSTTQGLPTFLWLCIGQHVKSYGKLNAVVVTTSLPHFPSWLWRHQLPRSQVTRTAINLIVWLLCGDVKQFTVWEPQHASIELNIEWFKLQSSWSAILLITLAYSLRLQRIQSILSFMLCAKQAQRCPLLHPVYAPSHRARSNYAHSSLIICQPLHSVTFLFLANNLSTM